MRVIECDVCGETITADNDGELAGRLAVHLREQHESEPDGEELEELVTGEAYDAMDS